MLSINDVHYTNKDLEEAFQRYEQLPFLKDAGKWRVAACFADSFDWLSLFFYIWKKGGSVVPVHAASPREAAIRMAKRAKSNVLFYGTVTEPIVFHEEPDADGVLIQMTSGTTGEPKCIARTWASIEEELESYNEALPVKNEVPIVACPVTHSYGLLCGVAASVKRGVEPVVASSPNPKYILKLLKNYPAHLFYGAPSLIHTIVQLTGEEKIFHKVMTSGTLLPAAWLERLLPKAEEVLQQYGCSEAGCISIHSSISKPDEMGKPLSHVTVKAGTVEKPDEIVVHKKGEVIHTKDVGYVSDIGQLHFLARLDDTINVAGLNVYPHEVESVLLAMPGVDEAVVFKKTDPFSGERVCVKYVSSSGVDEKQVRTWCRERLAPYQMPVDVIASSSIPTLPNGKMNRKQLSRI